MLGIALTRLSRRVEGTGHVIKVFQLLSDAIIEMVQVIMKIAPLGVFAMLAAVVADLGKDPAQLGDLLTSLGGYMATVVIALFVHYLVVYTALLKLLTNVPWRKFAKAMVPAQLLAFSSSSSAATLPVTIKSVEEGVGVDEEVSSFVLPLGATINMDGTGLYQGVAAVFIANALGVPLDLGQQLMIVLTAALASIGTAAVPGVGIVMLVIVLKQVGLPEAGIGLSPWTGRYMCRTVLNVTGDATVATIVASSEGLTKDAAASAARGRPPGFLAAFFAPRFRAGLFLRGASPARLLWRLAAGARDVPGRASPRRAAPRPSPCLAAPACGRRGLRTSSELA